MVLMLISVVIPAFNEEKYVKECLLSLVKQKTTSQFEVLVVDNNSADSTVKIVNTFKNRLNLRVIMEKKQGRGAARARGFRQSRGEIILSTDADAILPADWLETLTSNLGGEIVATTTSCKTLDLGPLKNTIFNFVQPTTAILYRLIFGHFWLAGFSFAIKRAAYLASGGFNPNLQSLEDADLAFRVSRLGKIKFINKPVIFSGRRFKGGLLSGLFQYVHVFIKAYLLEKETAYLSNIR